MTTNKTNTTNISEFTERMKNTDSRYAQIIKSLQIIYYVIIPLYFIMMVVQFFTDFSFYEIGGTFLMLLSLLIFAVLLQSNYKEYNTVDYALPTLMMLKKAAKRYRPFPLKFLWALLALLIMAVGMTLKNLEFDTQKVIIYFGVLVVVSVLGGFIWWYVRYKPLRDGALLLIDEIENDLLEE